MNCSGYELPTIEIPINIELDNDEIDNQESSLKRSHAEVIQSPTFAEITATLQKKVRTWCFYNTRMTKSTF